MKVARRQIAQAVTDLSTTTPPKRLASEVAAYLLSQNRSGELDSLMRDVMEERSARGIVEVSAVSTHTLSAGVLADIRREVKSLYPKARQIIISPKLDPRLIGGVRLEFANRQLDLTLRAKLNRLKQLITYGKD